MSTGFHSWNVFEKELRRLKQLYDFTVHVYEKEHERLEPLAREASPGNSITTGVAETTHDIISLYHATSRFYPNKLRELLLVSVVTILEAYLVDLVHEIFDRDVSPFLRNGVVEVNLSKLLTFSSVEAIQDDYLQSETRKLSNKGFKETRSYFNRCFGIDFGSLGVTISNIKEMHDRRHLFVHRNGICDAQYAHRYPKSQYRVGQRLEVSHDYIISVFTSFYDFALGVRNEALDKHPRSTRKKQVVKGKAAKNSSDDAKLLVRGEITVDVQETIVAMRELRVNSLSAPLDDYLVQVIVEEKRCVIIVGGPFEDISRFMKPLKTMDGVVVRSISKLYV